MKVIPCHWSRPLAAHACTAPLPYRFEHLRLLLLQAVGPPHQLGGDQEEIDRTLEEAGITVKIGDTTLEEGTTAELFSFVSYRVEVTAGNEEFRGILLRMQASGPDSDSIDMTGALMVGEGNLQDAFVSGCEPPEVVVGLTHMDRNDKSIAIGNMRLDAEFDSIDLDVTIVFVNNATISSYAYTGYELAFSLPTSDSEEPTSAPVEVSAEPSAEPTLGMTSASPSEQPAGVQETPSPVAPESEEPSLSPITPEVESDPPTEAPVAPDESASPSAEAMPSAMSEEPTAEPTFSMQPSADPTLSVQPAMSLTGDADTPTPPPTSQISSATAKAYGLVFSSFLWVAVVMLW